MTRMIVHAHFYQPPRENPWTNEIPEQPTAAPAHDWNERVHSECYRPNTRAKVATEKGEREVNNFERISFNVGPTLMKWMEAADPATYERILEADRESLERLGHGNAIAQAYHHTILPLSSYRDIRTQVRWGLADFKHRFGRDSEGIWLPETAVNADVLKVLIEEGVDFTILAPHQGSRWRGPDGRWIMPPLDTRLPYRYFHPDGSGRSITLMFYDGEIARAIAFEQASSSADGFLDLFESKAPAEDQVIHAATDGETYGHHHRFSELGLAYALFEAGPRRGFEITNYASYLERFPAELEADVLSGKGSSWSCAHGVGRWCRDCGCSTGGDEGWNQEWRAPLRDALELIRHAANEAFDRLGAALFVDPWRARDRYIEVLVGASSFESLLASEAGGPLDEDGGRRARTLLELQERAMAMYTSCGWFFNDIGGIETEQVLRYAAATLEILGADLGQPTPETAVIDLLQSARSNDPDIGSGADVYMRAASMTAAP